MCCPTASLATECYATYELNKYANDERRTHKIKLSRAEKMWLKRPQLFLRVAKQSFTALSAETAMTQPSTAISRIVSMKQESHKIGPSIHTH